MGNFLVILIIASILSLSIKKIVAEKRKGVRCVGCPHSSSCGNIYGRDDSREGCSIY